jgi:putative transposase
MLGNEELLAWFQSVRLPECGRSIVQQVRSSDPARRVGGGHRNVSGRYPSKKMGVTIQFESHRVELARIYELEHDPDVLEYWDQPPSYKLEYRSAQGKRIVTVHTPDYFVIRARSAGWEECKTEEELLRWSQKSPHRYCHRNDAWCCPPGEDYARPLGLTYSVRSSRNIHWIYQRNIQFLEDYFRDRETSVAPAARDLLIAHVSAQPGMSIQQLLADTDGSATCDDIHLMVALGELYVDLHDAPLAQPASVLVFNDAKTAAHHRDNRMTLSKSMSELSISQLRSGSTVNWDGRHWEILNCGQTQVVLRCNGDNSITQLPVAAFQILITEGQLTAASPQHVGDNAEVVQRLAQASEQDLRQGNYRYEIVRGILDKKQSSAGISTSPRTSRRWIAMYKKAEALYGNGYLGLLPQTQQRGNSKPKMPAATKELMEAIISEDYETHKQKSMYASWSTLQIACRDQGLIAPSYETFREAVQRKAGHSQTLKRMGSRAAYQQESFYWELELKTPRHGDRPFEIAHVDHTELDIELVCSMTGRDLGRPWLSLLTDAFSRRVLAASLSFDPPSYRSCMMIIRECVRRHSRLPQIVVVDGGSEFGSFYFETILARYECIKKIRPPAKARFGSVVERLFGTCNSQFIHNLRGNTQVMRQVRQVTKSVDPKRQAVWTLADLYDHLICYLYEVYDLLDHPALGQSPREAYETGMTRAGQRLWRHINNDREFFILTLPTTPVGTAQVLPGRGVKIHYICYWSDLFQDPEVERKQVPVRYDPFDAGIAFAFVKGQWVQCHSEYYAILRGHTEKEMMLATQELRKQRRQHARQRGLSAKAIGDFLQSLEAQEVLLTQRLRDHQAGPTRPESEHLIKPQLVAGDHNSSRPFLVVPQPQNGPVGSTEEYETYGAF